MWSAVSIGESFGEAFGFISTVVEYEFLWSSIVAEWFELGDDFFIGFFPADALPFSFSTFSYALERVEESFWVVGIGDHALSLGADIAL